MRKFNLLILILVFNLTTTQVNSQVIYSGSIKEQIERWEGKNSKNIIDYVLKLKLPRNKREIGSSNYFLVIRTEINGRDPVEYQITLREDGYSTMNNVPKLARKLMLIFEYPIGKSIQKQYEELKINKPDISFEEAALKIKVKQDTAIIDSTFKYYNLINEMFSLELPIIYEKYWIHNATWSQVYISNFSNKSYSLFRFGENEYKFPNWVERLFMAMIDHFNAIYPYPNIK